MKHLTKKHLLTALISLLLIVFCLGVFAACTTPSDPDEPDTPDTPVTPDDPDEPDEPDEPVSTDYVVYVLYPDGSGVAGVYVQWCNDLTCIPATAATDSDGKVVNSSLEDGEYHIKPFAGLPDGYTYAQDENGYYSGATATADNRTVTITLTEEAPSYSAPEGSGSWTDRYLLAVGTTYSVTASGEVFFEYEADATGYYLISVSDGSATIKQYTFGKYAFNTSDGNSLTITQEESDSFEKYFSVTISESGTFQITVSYEGELEEPEINTVYVEAKETSKAAYAKPADSDLVSVPMDGTANVYYRATDGLYHIGSNGDGTDPVLLVKLDGETQYLDRSLTSLDAEGSSGTYIFDTTAEGSTATTYSDYRMFLRGYLNSGDVPTGDYYSKYVNEDGVVAVTAEMAAYLKLLGVAETAWLEFCGVTFTADTAWLFACYYYAPAEGSQGNPVSLTYAGQKIKLTATVAEGGSVYYLLDGFRLATTLNVSSSDANAKLIYNGQSYSSANGFSADIVCDPVSAESRTFAISSADGKAASVVFTVDLPQGTIGNPYVVDLDTTSSVSVVITDAVSDVYYTFTSATGGTFTFSTTSNEGYAIDENYNNYGDGSGFAFNVTIAAGGSTTVGFNSYSFNAATYTVTVTKSNSSTGTGSSSAGGETQSNVSLDLIDKKTY